MGSSRIRLFRLASHHEHRLPESHVRFIVRRPSEGGNDARYTCTLAEAIEFLCAPTAEGDDSYLEIEERHLPVRRPGRKKNQQSVSALVGIVNRSGVLSLEKIRGPDQWSDGLTDYSDNPDPELTGQMRKWIIDIPTVTVPPFRTVCDQ